LSKGFKENFAGVLGEISPINIPRVFLIAFGTDKELSCWIGFLGEITGFLSIRGGLEPFGGSGKAKAFGEAKFSVIGEFDGSWF